MKHVMKHDLPLDRARMVAERAFDAYRDKYANYNPALTWLSDTKAKASFGVKGVTLVGVIELQPNAISFDLDVPFVFKVFKKKAMDVMDRELAHWLAKAKQGEI